MNAARISGLLLALTLGSGTGATAGTLEDAQQLLRDRKPAEAYQLLAPGEFEHAGELDYDYTLGIAALDSGHPDRATLALERALAVNPGFLPARIDLARAYFAMRDHDRAEREFRLALEQNPPEKTRQVLEQYLDAIREAREAGTPKTSGGFLDFTLGYDTNVNNAGDTAIVYVPGIQIDMTMNPSSLSQSDGYGQLNGQFYGATEVSDGVVGYWMGGARMRSNFSETDFNNGGVWGLGGLRFAGDRNTVSVGIGAQRYFLDGSPYWDRTGLAADWNHALDKDRHLMLFGQYNRFRYQEALMESEDMNQTVLGLGYTHRFADTTTGFATLYGGREDAINGRADGDKDLWGVKFGAEASVHPDVKAFGSIGAANNSYGKQNTLFEVTRDDRFYDLTVGANWQLDRNWIVRPQVSYYKNDSNIIIYQYDRTDASVTLRYVF